MQNVVATFDDPDSALYAIRQVQQAGISSTRIRFKPSGDTEFLKRAGSSQRRLHLNDPQYRPLGVLESLGGFFASLFESHTDESGIYAEALRRGTSLVLVQVERDEAQRIIRVLQDCGAISLEDRVGQWRADGWGRETAIAGDAAGSSRGGHDTEPGASR